MASKHHLRRSRAGTVINVTSKRQETRLTQALQQVCKALLKKFPGITLEHQGQWLLSEVVQKLRREFPDVGFHFHHATSSMRPDGGILSIVAQDGTRHPVLIAEKKNQGTNDLRLQEGKGKQAKGNAIERLGKNVIGFRAAMLGESIFPFVCFGDGCDFSADSSILDRVTTIAMFGRLNEECLHNQGPQGVFNRGSFFFRPEEWEAGEMRSICTRLAEKSVYYYFSKYGEDAFRPQPT